MLNKKYKCIDISKIIYNIIHIQYSILKRVKLTGVNQNNTINNNNPHGTPWVI